MKKNVNGIEMDMTEQEIAQREKDIQEYNNNKLNIKLEQLRDLTNGLDTVAKVENKLETQDGKLINFPVKPS